MNFYKTNSPQLNEESHYCSIYQIKCNARDRCSPYCGKGKRIERILRVYQGGRIWILMELSKYYSFDTSGSQVSYCSDVRDAYESTKHIVYCDGK